MIALILTLASFALGLAAAIDIARRGPRHEARMRALGAKRSS